MHWKIVLEKWQTKTKSNILQLLKKDISYPLSIIFNLSLTTGVHPDALKISKTIPVFKKGSKLETGNYRPISLLSNINKILEKLMYARIYKFLDKMKCFYKLQFGFRNRHSTAHALIEITEKIRQALDNGHSVSMDIVCTLISCWTPVFHGKMLIA